VRLSVKKAAYADLSRAACRKSGVVLGQHVPTSSPAGTAENYPGCNPGVLLSPKWMARNSQRESVGLVDQLSASACGLGSPRTNVLGHSQPSLRDWSRRGMWTQDCVLGYSQPSLRDSVWRASSYADSKAPHQPFQVPRLNRLRKHSCFVVRARL